MSYIIETFRWCQSNEYASKKVDGSLGPYHLSYGQHNPGPYQCNWHCDCPGFKYRGTCKHVTQAEEERCGHGWEAAAGSPSNDWVDGKCPECGAPAVPVKVAV